MPVRPMSARRPVWATLGVHSEIPAAERPAFLVRPFSMADLLDWQGAAPGDRQAFATLDERLVGWRGIVDDAGAAIPFRRYDAPEGTAGAAWREVLTDLEVSDLFDVIAHGTARVAPADAGKSSTPSG